MICRFYWGTSNVVAAIHQYYNSCYNSIHAAVRGCKACCAQNTHGRVAVVALILHPLFGMVSYLKKSHLLQSATKKLSMPTKASDLCYAA